MSSFFLGQFCLPQIERIKLNLAALKASNSGGLNLSLITTIFYNVLEGKKE